MIKRRPVVLKDIEAILSGAELYGTILGNTGAVFSIMDSDFNILHLNYFGREIFGKIHDFGIIDLNETKCYEYFRGESKPCPGCKTANTFDTCRPERDFIIHNRLVDRVFNVCAYPVTEIVDGETKAVAVLEVAEDITAKVISAGKAHDAKNLLTSVVGVADLALHSLKSSDDDKELVSNLELCVKSGSRIGSLLSDLQKILSGKSRWEDYTAGPVDLKSVVNESIYFIRPQYLKKKIALAAELDDVPVIEGHRNGLISVFENILRNSLEALAETQNPQVTVNLYHESGYIHVMFTDNGAGISPDKIDYIFNPYFTTKEKGHGLGLSVSKQIIEKRHFGKISVESSYGKQETGTTFTIKIPDPTTLKIMRQETWYKKS